MPTTALPDASTPHACHPHILLRPAQHCMPNGPSTHSIPSAHSAPHQRICRRSRGCSHRSWGHSSGTLPGSRPAGCLQGVPGSHAVTGCTLVGAGGCCQSGWAAINHILQLQGCRAHAVTCTSHLGGLACAAGRARGGGRRVLGGGGAGLLRDGRGGLLGRAGRVGRCCACSSSQDRQLYHTQPTGESQGAAPLHWRCGAISHACAAMIGVQVPECSCLVTLTSRGGGGDSAVGGGAGAGDVERGTDLQR